MLSFLRKLKYGIENLTYYLPTIWQDRDWDNWYFFKLIERKLTRMEQHERKYGHHVNSLRDAHKIKICKVLCRRILNQDYTTPFDKRYEPIFKRFCEAVFNPVMENGWARVKCDKTSLEHKISCWKYEHEDYMKEQDLDLLFKILRKNIQGWWN